ncbi:LPS export ABC transporter periplasmic protein LptC [Thalassotalea ponticola]|uniref:LPS export ABC transporter periplasmic protein LptC n=1 Tax=Thalassotalea ponticola TaxID=1523392 RepID=UPI0025B3C4B9|nr:LPS export ABC transporter periplasmic protein LptC [Thalassotalea ponticola]MDN3653516.1 LPS export ABC transporter periplasmic protein LptC [Thalassotalea ponticola]
MTRSHYISIILFVIAIAIYGYLQYQQSLKLDRQPLIEINEPAFVAKALTAKKFDKDGQLIHTIYAEQMTHFDQTAETQFVAPAYTIYPTDGSTSWRLSADSGLIGRDNILMLENQVRLSNDDQLAYISEVQATSLLLDLNTKIITSEQDIKILGKDFTMYGSGLEINATTTEMTLSDHVQTIFKKRDQ